MRRNVSDRDALNHERADRHADEDARDDPGDEREVCRRVNSPTYMYATAVIDDSASRMRPSAARKSFFANPWLFSMIASGGPEIVVTE